MSTPSYVRLNGKRTVDVAIVGGGIAGSALAVTLARGGMNVALIEREPQFRDRIRGESIHPWGVRELTALDLRSIVIEGAKGRELPRWTRYRNGELLDSFAWSDVMTESPGEISVHHPDLQRVMLEEARNAGVLVFQPAECEPWRENGRIGLEIVAGDKEATIECRLLVGADGQRSGIRRWIGGKAERDPVHHSIGGALVSGFDLPPDSAHQAFFPGGFGMVFPQAGGTNRIYYVCSQDTAADLQRAPQPEALVALLEPWFPAGVVKKWESAGPAGFFPNSDLVSDVLHAGKVVLIGDAASANDPSQGHGLSLVFRDVRELRDLLLTNEDWSDVPARYAEQRARYYDVLRQHARWSGPLMTDIGPEADEVRVRVAAARKKDPTAGGFAAIFLTGPDPLIADEAARKHFLGEDLP
jgi:2-polyprenyl-6-methoxyphenol hydroxylase-like FAD-dependent oxidoreductase